MTTTDLADTIAAAETLARAGHPYELRHGRLGTFVTLLDGEGDSLSVQLDERCAGRHCAEHPRPTPADLDTWAEDSPYIAGEECHLCEVDETQEWTPEALNRLRDVLIDADPEMWNHDPHTDWPAYPMVRADVRKRCSCGDPDAYALTPGEVIGHSPDGCSIGPDRTERARGTA